MMTITRETKLKDVVLNHPAAAPVLEKAGLDYCCGGKQTVGEACLHAGMPAEELLARLREAAKDAAPETQTWTSAPLADVTRHILEKHHAYVRAALPRIEQLLGKVAEKHGERHPELAKIRESFHQLGRELTQHMQKEEFILFPYLEILSAASEAGEQPEAPFFGTVQNPVAAMLKEHDSAGEFINEISRLSAGYTAPAEACTTYELLYRELAEFDHDLRQHVHLENNVLFPRAVEMEQKIVSR